MEDNKKQNVLIWSILVINIIALVVMSTVAYVGWGLMNGKVDQQALESTKQGKEPAMQTGTTTQQVPPGDELGEGRCGDGVCDLVEKANAKLCPVDCK